ncbi:MAG: hypothetical protein IPK81_00825 [Rhodospirillales bacterium]|nr:MAG: hypothetical protein IPK81_00825 [Rhodospirillales bacterium]
MRGLARASALTRASSGVSRKPVRASRSGAATRSATTSSSGRPVTASTTRPSSSVDGP